jgi:hypothetical protein
MLATTTTSTMATTATTATRLASSERASPPPPPRRATVRSHHRRRIARDRRYRLPAATRASSSSSSSSSDEEEINVPGRAALALGWLALGGVATTVAPSGTAAFDAELVTSLVTSPFSGAANPIFEALFNSLGVVPAVYAALLLPGARDQPRVPTLPPVVASFALGFFALGPYLITRRVRVVLSTFAFLTHPVQ